MPLLAVAKQIKSTKPETKVHAVYERGSDFASLFNGHYEIDEIHNVYAGKYRRYYGESMLRRLTDVKTLLLNIRDFFFVAVGIIESLVLLLRLRPDVVLVKGGYVGVPLGIAARLLRVPYVTHDSDATAGLANKIIGSHARFNTVGMSTDYQYDKLKTKYVGVPISQDYSKPYDKGSIESRQKLYGITKKNKVLLILGGSNGAKRLDAIVHKLAQGLLEKDPSLFIVHQVGRGNEDLYNDLDKKYLSRIVAKRFISPLFPILRTASIVVSRAGATTLTELAATSKPTILIPHPELSGGHQLKNAQILENKLAVVSIDEQSLTPRPDLLKEEILRLLNNPKEADAMGHRLHTAMKLNATELLTNLLFDIAEENPNA